MTLPKTAGAALEGAAALMGMAGRSTARAVRAGVGSYKVRRGDTLSSVAQRLLGRAGRWREIAKLNGIPDPRKLRIGQVLTLPSAPGRAREAARAEPEPARRPRILPPRTVKSAPAPAAPAKDDELAASDPISLVRLVGLDRSMARIYNEKGRYLHEAARRLGVDSACAAAVLRVESGGSGFGPDGRMTIRFENHVFFDRWGRNHPEVFHDHFEFDSRRRWRGHHYRDASGARWTRCHTSQSQEWEVLALARRLHDELALQSISMGAAQIMGFNHDAVGHSSARRMFDRMSASLRAQLDGMFAFIAGTKGCLAGLRARDYETFARGYNGSGEAGAYGARLRRAAEAYRRLVEGRRFA